MFLAIPATIYIPVPVLIGFAALIAAVVIGTAMMNRKKTAAPAAEVVAAPVAAAPAAALATGSAGQLKLFDTPPKTAAMVMAIVADKLGKPMNELRFISIKEVK